MNPEPIIAQKYQPPQDLVDAVYENEEIPAAWPPAARALAEQMLTEDRHVYDAYIRKQETTDQVGWQAAQFSWQVAQDNRNRTEKALRAALFAWQEGRAI